jgi:hypothetical protein
MQKILFKGRETWNERKEKKKRGTQQKNFFRENLIEIISSWKTFSCALLLTCASFVSTCASFESTYASLVPALSQLMPAFANLCQLLLTCASFELGYCIEKHVNLLHNLPHSSLGENQSRYKQYLKLHYILCLCKLLQGEREICEASMGGEKSSDGIKMIAETNFFLYRCDQARIVFNGTELI